MNFNTLYLKAPEGNDENLISRRNGKSTETNNLTTGINKYSNSGCIFYIIYLHKYLRSLILIK